MLARVIAVIAGLLVFGGVTAVVVTKQLGTAPAPVAPGSEPLHTAVSPTDRDPSAPEDSRIRHGLVLEDGRLRVADVIVALYESLEHEPPDGLERLPVTINTRSFLGRAQLGVIGTLARGAVAIEVGETDATLVVDRVKLESALAATERSEREWLDRFAATFAAHFGGGLAFGVRVIGPDGEPMAVGDAVDVAGRLPGRMVLLVHGLDDPGWLWRDVIPALQDAGHAVARFDYPNDGPVSESADLLAMELARLRERGVQRVDIVAHSMGGLVTRDVLTRPAHYAGDGGGRPAGEGDAAPPALPAIDRLIMLGTPNHGSQLARIRALSEVKEQITRAFRQDGGWMASLADGEGEAGEDLLPGSPLLAELNGRPLATHTAYTIVAGRVSPVSEGEMGLITSALRMLADSANPPAWLRERLRETEREADQVFGELVRGVGDGCVTIDSARLEGVDDFVLVEANHVSMIAEVVPLPDHEPPAIAVVLERLERSRGDDER